MRETDWAAQVTFSLNEYLSLGGSSLRAKSGMRLMYANEIREYSSGDPVYNEMTYQTDILVYEEVGGAIHKPRVVIETKVESITTHDAITYSQKAATHKAVHPYLRYGIFLGKRDHYPLPGRLFRHGAQFDFMLSWSGYESSKEEWKALVGIIEAEVTASRNLEEMIFNSRSKQRKSYTILHKPLYVS